MLLAAKSPASGTSNPFAKLLPESDRLAEIAVRLGLTIVVAIAIRWLLSLAIGRLETILAAVDEGGENTEQRARTLAGVLRRTMTALVVAGALIHGLDVMG